MNDATHIVSAIEQDDPSAAGQLRLLVYKAFREAACPKTRKMVRQSDSARQTHTPT